MVWPYSTGWPSSTHISLTTPSAVEGTWFIVFIASTIIIVSPFLIFFPISTNFLAPGSGEWYAVPIIGDVISIPDFEFWALLVSELTLIDGDGDKLIGCWFTDILFFETLIFVSLSVYSISVRPNSSK